MSKKKQVVRITVSGTWGTGKSALVRKIAAMLSNYGITTTTEELDSLNPEMLPAEVAAMNERVLHAISDKVKVHVEEVISRGPVLVIK